MSARIVITGAGVISPLGAGLQEFADRLYAGHTGIGASPLLGGTRLAAEVPSFNPEPWLGNKGIRVLDRTARLLSVAAHMALACAGSPHEGAEGPVDVGLVCGTMFGSLNSIAGFDWSGLTDGMNFVNPMHFPNTVINSAAGQAAIRFRLRGINSTICAGLASGLYALDYARDFLTLGRARMLLAGGVEELCEPSYAGFEKTGLVSPSGQVRPFAADRDGTAPGEGAALLNLETAENAAARGAAPWVEIRGFGASHDAFRINSFAVNGEGAAAAMRQALESARITPDQVSVIVSSAGGGRASDEMESCALQQVFGPALSSLPACAPKAALGECMGAFGGFAALTGALALTRGEAPPTPCAPPSSGPVRLSRESQPIAGEYALVNAFGCDGNNASLVLKKWNA